MNSRKLEDDREDQRRPCQCEGKCDCDGPNLGAPQNYHLRVAALTEKYRQRHTT